MQTIHQESLFPWIRGGRPALVLAPMEGVTDAPMRLLLTEMGGFDYCVSEFLRIGQEILPSRTYFQHIPELKFGSQTPSGAPIQVQLLGGNKEKLAISALRACELGANAIDLNFGCPAKTVNRHDGGASLLRHPERIREIVAAVRQAVPPYIPVSAKLRLGWDRMEDVFVNCEQAMRGGVSWITIHARTKTQGYSPPAYWKYIGEVNKHLGIPIVANGEIWTIEDFLKCQEQTECEHFMLGRGALSNPILVHQISRQLRITSSGEQNHSLTHLHDPSYWVPILQRFAEIVANFDKNPQYPVCRIKQWFKFVHAKNPLPWFDEIKLANSLAEIFAILRKY